MTSSEFEKHILQLKDKLYRFALSILNNSEDAGDAVQEVVLKLWKNKSSLNKSQNFDSYCLNTVKNYCFDLLRKRKNFQDYQKIKDNNLIINSNFENTDLVEKLRSELKRLPAQQQMAIELKDFQGLEYEEISEILEQSVNSIRANVSRGRKKLYEIFKEELADV